MKKILLCILGLCAAVAVHAIPARPGFVKVAQPDGTIIELQKLGDENFHCFVTREGKPMLRDNDGFFRFAAVSDGKIALSSNPAMAASVSQLAEAASANRKTPVRIHSAVRRNLSRRPSDPDIPQYGLGLFTGNFPREGKIRSLVFLVEFQDTKFESAESAEYFKKLFNTEGFSENGNYGSVRDYFYAQSNGKFDIEFDVFGPMTLAHPHSYYGKNSGYYESDENAHEMAVEAAAYFDKDIDFSKYDFDGDGHIDNIFVVYAGYGEADNPNKPDLVWPHAWNIYRAGETPIRHDGKILDGYCCVNELENYVDWADDPEYYGGDSNINCIGTFVHEFSHVLGLPDLYMTAADDNYTGYYETPGYYSTLDVNPYATMGRCPAAYGAFERNAIGWAKPTVIRTPGEYTLDELQKSNSFYLIPTEVDTEFFLLENRQITDYDSSIPGHGMLVWHIDFNQKIWDSNTVNNRPGHNCVDIVEAGGKANYYHNPEYDYYDLSDTYPFPGTNNVTELTAKSTPALVSWSKKALEFDIRDIAESEDGIITFKAVADIKNTRPQVIDGVSGSRDEITFRWKPVLGASKYYLTAGTIEEGTVSTNTYDFINGAPAGWTFTGKTTGSTGNYGADAPSLVFDKGASLTTEFFDTQVSKIAFWHKATISETPRIKISGRSSGSAEWSEITTVASSKTASTTAIDLPAGIRQIKMENTATRGEAYIDDLALTLDSSVFTPLGDLDRKDVGNVTEFKALVSTNADRIYFYVTAAADNGDESLVSNPGVITFDLSGIENAATDVNAPLEYYNLQGIRVKNPAPGIYILRQGTAVRKVFVR